MARETEPVIRVETAVAEQVAGKIVSLKREREIRRNLYIAVQSLKG